MSSDPTAGGGESPLGPHAAPDLSHPEIVGAVVGAGVLRVSWSARLQDSGFEAASAAVRDVVDEQMTNYRRVEAHVDPTDLAATRIATWSGLQREGVMRAALDGLPASDSADRVVFARISSDDSIFSGRGFRSVLNSFLPRKRAISQMLIRDEHGRVLLCNLTYKKDWDLPGGVVEVGESPKDAVTREVHEELALTIDAGPLLLTDWLPAWSGWDDALCLVFDGGVHDASLASAIVAQAREIRGAEFVTLRQAHNLCADFTARRIDSALANLDETRPTHSFTESGRPV